MTADVWIVVQQRAGKLHKMSWEAIAAGQALAAATGGQASAVVLGSDVGSVADQIAGRAALAGVLVADHEALGDYTPGGYLSVLAPALDGADVGWVVLPHTYQTVDYAPRLAERLGAAVVPEVVGMEPGEAGPVWKRPILNGKLQARVRVRGDRRAVVSVQSGAWSAEALVAGTSAVSALGHGEIEPDREILGVEEVSGEQVDLSSASIIVAVGRGIGGADKMGPIEELAREMGAEIGASRPVIDNDWLPRDRQIGSSGQTVAPKLYLALGISGAIQHLVGMKGAQTVVAINKDASAPIFGLADYGIVGDLHELVPELVEALREAAD